MRTSFAFPFTEHQNLRNASESQATSGSPLLPQVLSLTDASPLRESGLVPPFLNSQMLPSPATEGISFEMDFQSRKDPMFSKRAERDRPFLRNNDRQRQVRIPPISFPEPTFDALLPLLHNSLGYLESGRLVMYYQHFSLYVFFFWSRNPFVSLGTIGHGNSLS